jgi:hypothetical protein
VNQFPITTTPAQCRPQQTSTAHTSYYKPQSQQMPRLSLVTLNTVKHYQVAPSEQGAARLRTVLAMLLIIRTQMRESTPGHPGLLSISFCELLVHIRLLLLSLPNYSVTLLNFSWDPFSLFLMTSIS